VEEGISLPLEKIKLYVFAPLRETKASSVSRKGAKTQRRIEG
jgi:hypothetical protein